MFMKSDPNVFTVLIISILRLSRTRVGVTTLKFIFFGWKRTPLVLDILVFNEFLIVQSKCFTNTLTRQKIYYTSVPAQEIDKYRPHT